MDKKGILKEKEYPKSHVFERAYVIKLFHNKDMLNKHLDSTLPNIFLDKRYRLIIYLMKMLKSKDINITIENMAIYCSRPDNRLNAFFRRHHIGPLSYDELHDILYEPGIDSSSKLIDIAKKELLNRSFARFVEDAIADIKYMNSYTLEAYHPAILGKAKAITKVHDILYDNVGGNRDQLQEAKHLINSTEEYITTCSQLLNSYIGGFTRGYVDSVIAKSSHCKSSWIDYNILHTISSGKIEKRILKITPEEDAATQLRRYIATICKISTTSMRMKMVEITNDHLRIVKDKLNDKLIIVDNAFKYKDIIEVMNYTKNIDMIVIDHLQSIEYPGKGTYLHNMIGNIPGLIGIQKKIAKQLNIPIINLSQVGDKEIQKSDRLVKAPRYWDAYGSSVLYQASREFLALWYPYKDYEEQIVSTGTVPSINDIQISIEKSSFSTIGKLDLHFDPEFNIFTDKNKEKKLKKLDYIAPEEATLF